MVAVYSQFDDNRLAGFDRALENRREIYMAIDRSTMHTAGLREQCEAGIEQHRSARPPCKTDDIPARMAQFRGNRRQQSIALQHDLLVEFPIAVEPMQPDQIMAGTGGDDRIVQQTIGKEANGLRKIEAQNLRQAVLTIDVSRPALLVSEFSGSAIKLIQLRQRLGNMRGLQRNGERPEGSAAAWSWSLPCHQADTSPTWSS
mgnify:FL=1